MVYHCVCSKERLLSTFLFRIFNFIIYSYSSFLFCCYYFEFNPAININEKNIHYLKLYNYFMVVNHHNFTLISIFLLSTSKYYVHIQNAYKLNINLIGRFCKDIISLSVGIKER